MQCRHLRFDKRAENIFEKRDGVGDIGFRNVEWIEGERKLFVRLDEDQSIRHGLQFLAILALIHALIPAMIDQGLNE